ncbi:MAG: T9SS type A sorting domain-containing protein [Bacteroidota bacterium]
MDIAAKTFRSAEGSNVFAVSDEGKLAYYNDRNSTIGSGELSFVLAGPVYRILFFGADPLFITRTSVLKMGSNGLSPVFTAAEGRVFDAGVIEGRLYISTKKELPGEFLFRAYHSADLLSFTAADEVHYPLAGATQNKTQQNSSPSSLPNETILNPIDYYTDTVYQPVGNSYNEMQEYSQGNPYPHPGVDLLGAYLQNTYSVKDGFVKAILTTSGQYHWRIAIANQNTSGYSQGYLYAHLEQSTIPYTVGDPVNEADVVGLLVNFPVTGFVHLHFARIGCTGATWSGNWHTFDNPLSYMSNFFDTIPPTFEITINNDPFAFRDPGGNYLSPDSLYGNVRVISKVYDRINASWHCDVHKLRYSVSPLAQPTLMLLDSLSWEYHHYNDYYFQGPTYMDLINTIYSRDLTCFSTADYNVRDFYHIVTNSDGNDTITANDALQVFNTLSLPNGSYIYRVIAWDPSGNTSRDSMIIEIKNTSSGVGELLSNQVSITSNPFSSETVIVSTNGFNNATLVLYNAIGQQAKEIRNINGHTYILQRDTLQPGIYFIALSQGDLTLFTGKIVLLN